MIYLMDNLKNNPNSQLTEEKEHGNFSRNKRNQFRFCDCRYNFMEYQPFDFLVHFAWCFRMVVRTLLCSWRRTLKIYGPPVLLRTFQARTERGSRWPYLNLFTYKRKENNEKNKYNFYINVYHIGDNLHGKIS